MKKEKTNEIKKYENLEIKVKGGITKEVSEEFVNELVEKTWGNVKGTFGAFKEIGRGIISKFT